MSVKVVGRIHVNLNKSGVNLASRVTIFNAVVFVLTYYRMIIIIMAGMAVV